jgi:two-component system response regulator AlgR
VNPSGRLPVLVVDDNAANRRAFESILESDYRVVLAESGWDALDFCRKQEFAVIVLDVRMPGMDGFETAEALRRQERTRLTPIIFTTAFDSYALKAFEVNAIDYLLKPIRIERLLAALNKTRASPKPSRDALDAAANQPRRHLSVHERGKIILVPLADVLYLRAELKYVTVRTVDREFLVEESLSRLEEEFADAFVRVHRNCLVARSAIAGFERNAEDSDSGWAVVVRGTGEKLPVSRRQHHVVKQFR